VKKYYSVPPFFFAGSPFLRGIEKLKMRLNNVYIFATIHSFAVAKAKPHKKNTFLSVEKLQTTFAHLTVSLG